MRTAKEIEKELLQLHADGKEMPKTLKEEYYKAACIERSVYEEESYNRYTITENIPLERLEEICKAESDGLLLMLPCKIRTKIYKIHNSPKTGSELLGLSPMSSKTIRSKLFELSDINDTFYLNEADAKQALKRVRTVVRNEKI